MPDMKCLKTIAMAVGLTFGQAAQASELVIGSGVVEFNSNLAANDRQFTFEYRFDPYREWDKGQISWGVAVVGHASGDVWAGAGLIAQRHFGDRWFAEASLMPGLYFENGPATALGHTIEFRSVLAVGYEITKTSSISLAIDHRSNGGLSEFNPGSNGLSLRFHHKF
ncbi:acyloxyacyl hydrolase [Sulfitobacter mediterraneus]|uniref:acyloxyacyl hydrolase n=1 Tax=Sulfitobacter mediterraneus TaxID=83219 RepID=UPI0019318EA0|nr:acyloxyacyl hydrolase [Sulfitobacter mediterraneus]MBM1634968.1 acyloxyacyl hydrolase [Sulfitobacter mediterraneus]MBM1642743.1 acyloxyacyl hydrolase [Sulfitobacter mediterraneus]MBM1646791.1 acyloxyacyl hydrolase [Sulfitobacter mediterraneus]MBM1650881.1 acyloxyacyl hydrolase [Sulfitobacter mediterraneus]MBM1654859.1 acyloxyacyl hydrolase [Sulfitobacter mediterraneus]